MFPLFAVPATPELLIIIAIIVLLFGASKLPRLARSSGQAIGEFKRGREEVEAELEEMSRADREEDRDEVHDELREKTA